MATSITLVDDDPDVIELCRVCLSIAGFEVSAHTSGEDALEALARKLPDLLILDLMMPGLDGVALMKRVQQTFGADAPPVIILTAKARPGVASALQDEGAIGVLFKPFSPAYFADQVQEILDAQEPRES